MVGVIPNQQRLPNLHSSRLCESIVAVGMIRSPRQIAKIPSRRSYLAPLILMKQMIAVILYITGNSGPLVCSSLGIGPGKALDSLCSHLRSKQISRESSVSKP